MWKLWIESHILTLKTTFCEFDIVFMAVRGLAHLPWSKEVLVLTYSQEASCEAISSSLYCMDFCWLLQLSPTVQNHTQWKIIQLESVSE